jgi:hypothetical protein
MHAHRRRCMSTIWSEQTFISMKQSTLIDLIFNTCTVTLFIKISNFFNKVFMGYQPWQFVKNHQHFRDHLCPHHQGNDVTVCQVRPTYMPPKRPCLILNASRYGANGCSQVLAKHGLAFILVYLCTSSACLSQVTRTY